MPIAGANRAHTPTILSDMSAPAIVATPVVKKAKAPKAAKTAPSHPTYAAMVKAAIKHLKEKNGSSKQAILKYIMINYKLGSNAVQINSRLRSALIRGVAKKLFTQPKGVGANGRFRVSEAAPKVKKAPKAKKPTAKKTGEKKVKSPKKKVTKAKTAKKAASPKKAKAPKKAKSPKKPKAVKPKAAKPKSPKKAKVVKPKVAKAPKA